MENNEHLPSQFDFFQQSLRPVDDCETVEKCTICLDPFCASHQPVRISTCNHVFGESCIRTWLSSPAHNTCPLCRNLLFQSEPDTISESDDEDLEEEESEYENDDGMDIWDNDNDSDYFSEYDDANEDSDDEVVHSNIAGLQHQPQRRSVRLSTIDRPIYNEDEIASTHIDLRFGITQFVSNMWLSLWSLVEESQSSVPTKPIRRESILAVLADLEQPYLPRSSYIESLTIMVARRMIRKHRENERYIHDQNHTEDVDDLCAEATRYC